MALEPGHRLGPYQIVAPLGAGGMKEVYRARDANLNREVAVRVLPAEVAGDPDRLARFEREAQLLGKYLAERLKRGARSQRLSDLYLVEGLR
jgi:serine/threonine protein kinase